MALPTWLTRIIPTWSKSLPGTWRRAGRPCTEAPCPSTTLRAWTSRIASCQRAVSAGQVAVCCQCSSMMSKYSVLARRAELVELLLRIDAVLGRHLRHHLVAVARNALQGDAEHLVHLAVRFGRLEEADAVVVGVAHQPREPVLPELALHPAAEAARAERQPCDLDARPAERDQIGRLPALRGEGKPAGHGQRSRGQPGLEEFASRASAARRHGVVLRV